MLNEHLKKLRELNNVTQQQLAEYLNISTQSVSKWEKGLSLPSIEFLPKMANFFRCCVGTFFIEKELNMYEKFYFLNDADSLALIMELSKEDRTIYVDDEKVYYSIDSYFLSALYQYLKDQDLLSIKDIQEKLMVGYTQIMGIFSGLFCLGIIEKDNGGYKYNKEKVKLLFPFIKDRSKSKSLQFNEHLKSLRNSNRVSQKQLASYLKVSAQSISKWEKGTALPSTELLLKIVALFKCSIDAFFSDFDFEFYEQFSAMSPKELFEFLYKACSNVNDDIKDSPPQKEDVDFPLESLFPSAVYKYLQDNERVSANSIQQAINIGYVCARNILDNLYNMDIISYIKPGIYAIEKDKIDLLLPYINCHKGE